jgi:hypothetical protein
MLNKIITDVINSSIVFLKLLKKNSTFLIIISLFGLFLGVYLENYNFKKKGQFKGFAEVDVINKSFLSMISDFDSSEYSISKYAGFIKNKKYLLNGLDRLTNLSERFNNEFKSSKLNIKEFYDEDINKYCITDKNKHFDSYIDISTNNDSEIKRINLIILNNSKSEVENCFNYIKKILIIKKNKFIKEELKKIDSHILHLTNMQQSLNKKETFDTKESYGKFFDLFAAYYQDIAHINKNNNKIFNKDDQQIKEYFITELYNSEKNILYPYELLKDEKNNKIYLYKNINYTDIETVDKISKKNFLKIELFTVDEFLQKEDFFTNVVALKSSVLIDIEKKLNLLNEARNSINDFTDFQFSELIITEQKIKRSYAPIVSFLFFLISGIFLIYFRNFSKTNR